MDRVRRESAEKCNMNELLEIKAKVYS